MAQLVGVLTPFCRDQKGDWAHGSGGDLIRSKVMQCLGTEECELPWDTRRGNRLHLLRHKSLPESVMRDAARAYVRAALEPELPDVVVTDVTVTRGKDSRGLPTVIGLRVVYDVVDPVSGNVKLSAQVAEIPQI